jgi:hypothetical protein
MAIDAGQQEVLKPTPVKEAISPAQTHWAETSESSPKQRQFECSINAKLMKASVKGYVVGTSEDGDLQFVSVKYLLDGETDIRMRRFDFENGGVKTKDGIVYGKAAVEDSGMSIAGPYLEKLADKYPELDLRDQFSECDAMFRHSINPSQLASDLVK